MSRRRKKKGKDWEARTSPSDLVIKVQAPRNRRMTKPPRTVLISGIPLCLACIPYSWTRSAAQYASNIYNECRVSALRVQIRLGRG